MRGSTYLISLSLMVIGGCSSSGEDEPNDEPGDYACLVCLGTAESTAEEWANEGDCSAYEEVVNPVADCFNDSVVQISFEDCRRKPGCVVEESPEE